MTTAIRILMLALLITIAGGASTQETTTAPAATREAAAPSDSTAASETATAAEGTEAAEGTAAGASLTSYDIRNQFSNLLRQSPSELSTILVLDPTLLSNDAFLSGYPELSRFVSEHPEVRRNPRFYLAEFGVPRHDTVLEEIMEALAIIGTIGLIAFTLAWLIRTIIEQRRWNRLSRTQSEVHNKILDRFGSTGELLEYIRTPAGTKFLESAPIALHAEKPAQKSPMTRVIWSIQLGIVAVTAGFGMLLLSLRFEKESAEGLFALGAIALSIGVGFIASAAVSLLLSRRLGVWDTPAADISADRLDEAGRVR